MKQSKYNAEYCKLLVDHMKDGNSYESFGTMCNVTEETLNNWCKKHPAFQMAKDLGKMYELDYWEKLLKRGAVGDLPPIKKRITTFTGDKKIKTVVVIDEPGKFNATSVIFALKNKFPKLYREKIELTNGGDGTDNLTPEEIKRRKELYASIVIKK